MVIKKYGLFLENTKEENLKDIPNFFLEIEDMKYDFYEIKNGNGESYKKVHDIKYKITDSGNYTVNIYCDYLYHHLIQNIVRDEIEPKLKEFGYKVASIRKEKTSITVRKEVPISGKDYFSTVYDHIYKVSVLIKKEL